jgi:coenzyme F420-reducing hydrogenase beta subunit
VLKLTDKPDEIIGAQQSKYCPVALNKYLSIIRNSNKRIAIVGLPCHMHGLWNIEKEIPDYLNNVVLRIGLFCDRILTYAAINALIKSAGLQEHNITEFRYRSKRWRGWPGDVYIKNGQGEEINLPREIRYVIKDNFTPARCRLCYDKLNTFADISVGDSYGVSESLVGISSIIIRNENIHKLILSAEKCGKIRLQHVDPYRIVSGQAIEEKKKQFILFSSAWERMGYVTPKYSLYYDFKKIDKTFDLSPYENILRSDLNFHEKKTLKNKYTNYNNTLLELENHTNGNRKIPLVTVLMTAGMYDRYIENSIMSVLEQTYQNFEMIIAVDKSNKKLKNLLTNINSKKIRVIEKKYTKICNFQSLISDYAVGDYITFLDPQDEYEKNKIEIEVALMLGFPELKAVYSDLNVIDNNGKGSGIIWSYNNRIAENMKMRLLRNGNKYIPLHDIMMLKNFARELNINHISSLTIDNRHISEIVATRKIKHVYLPLYRYRCTNTES